jgi:hypothetical protein
MTVREILSEELETLRGDVIQRQKDAGAMATGETARGYETEASGMRGQLTGYYYAPVLETGRKPGKVPRDFKAIIRRWIEAKGLQPRDGETIDRMASSIAWVIRTEGTWLHRNGIRADIYGTPAARFSERTARRVAEFYTAQTRNKVYESWQK